MDQYSNIILAVIFGAIGIWLWIGFFKTRNLIYKDRMWNISRILFLAIGILCIPSMFVYSSALDWVRLIAMLVCIAAFLLLRDGIGEKGAASLGRMYDWKEIRAYDYKRDGKDFKLYLVVEDGKSKSKDDFNIIIKFDPKDEEAIKAYLKEKIGKKYTRMRKG